MGLGWPNLISLFRIVLVPPLVALVLVQTKATSYVAAGMFLVVTASDALDGYLARKHQMTTATGKWLDPLSDKLLVIAPMVALSMQGRFPVAAAAVIIAREAAVSGLRVWLGRRRTSMPASGTGKLKTVSQILAIALYLLPGVSPVVRIAFLTVALVLTVFSGAEYFIRAGSLSREPT